MLNAEHRDLQSLEISLQRQAILNLLYAICTGSIEENKKCRLSAFEAWVGLPDRDLTLKW